MRRLVFACFILMATVLSPLQAFGQEGTSGDPLEARIGGTRASFEAVYGAPTNDPNALVLEYAIRPFGRVDVTYREEQVFSVSVFADRLGHEPLTEPDDEDFNSARGSQVARRFLPEDVVVHELRQLRSNGDQLVRCQSGTLAGAFTVETYREFGFQGQPGDCQFRLHADDAGAFYKVEVTLGDGLPQEPTTGSNQTTSPPSDLSADEEDYLTRVFAELVTIGVSLETFSELTNQASEDLAYLDDPDWNASMASVLDFWETTYVQNRDLQPPATYEALHQKYVEGLETLDSAGQDIGQAIETLDAELLEQGAAKLETAGTTLVEVLDEVVAAMDE